MTTDEAELHRALGRVEGKLDTIHTDIKDQQAQVRSELNQLWKKVSELEAWRWKSVGYMAGAGLVIGFIIEFIKFAWK